ncbi:MAG: SWIM zinc finger domain-containing protein, partial [Deinococcota bacterium]
LQTLVPDWPDYKQDLLKRLQNPATFYLYDPREAVGILLREACYDEAISVTEKFPHDTALVIKVMDAVIHSHSTWVIATSKDLAETIMDAGNSNRYEDAVNYLSYVKEAYLSHDRVEPWEDYVQGLVDTHKRKRKLMKLMEPLIE